MPSVLNCCRFRTSSSRKIDGRNEKFLFLCAFQSVHSNIHEHLPIFMSIFQNSRASSITFDGCTQRAVLMVCLNLLQWFAPESNNFLCSTIKGDESCFSPSHTTKKHSPVEWLDKTSHIKQKLNVQLPARKFIVYEFLGCWCVVYSKFVAKGTKLIIVIL